MKKLLLVLVACAGSLALSAQTLAKKYVLIEHFTNSRCSVCASKNPGFYNLINDYPEDIHHISIHPSVPYNTCIFYLANPSENNARTSFYNVSGTPQIALNGTLNQTSGLLLSVPVLESYLNQTSPVAIEVTETGTTDRVATVKVRSIANVPTGNYKIYAAVVEKTINYNAPNGEAVHHDVFRKMLPGIDGQPIVPAAAGQSITTTFSYSLGTFSPTETYVVAFLQNTLTKEILNSGTRFDPLFTAAHEAAPQQITLQPNPAQDVAIAQLGDDQAESVEVFSMSGLLVSNTFTAEQNTVTLPTATLAAGVYFVKIRGKNGVYVAKLAKL